MVGDQSDVHLRRIEKHLADINHTLMKTNTLLYELVRLQIKKDQKELDEDAGSVS